MMNQNEQLDDLIDSSLDFTLSGEALARLAAFVAEDPVARDRFEGAMRSQRVLSTGAKSLNEIAQSITFPANAAPAEVSPHPGRFHSFIGRAATVAAVLAFSAASWMISGNLARQQVADNANVTPVASTAQHAFANYMQVGLDEGRILRELPPLTVELQTNESGTVVVYVRRLLEQAPVDDVYRVGRDEIGRPVAVPMNLAALTPGQSL